MKKKKETQVNREECGERKDAPKAEGKGQKLNKKKKLVGKKLQLFEWRIK